MANQNLEAIRKLRSKFKTLGEGRPSDQRHSILSQIQTEAILLLAEETRNANIIAYQALINSTGETYPLIEQALWPDDALESGSRHG